MMSLRCTTAKLDRPSRHDGPPPLRAKAVMTRSISAGSRTLRGVSSISIEGKRIDRAELAWARRYSRRFPDHADAHDARRKLFNDNFKPFGPDTELKFGKSLLHCLLDQQALGIARADRVRSHDKNDGYGAGRVLHGVHG